MGLVQTVPPASEPVSLATQKNYSRVSISDDDTLLSTLISTAREYCEHYTNRQFVSATWKLTTDMWPLNSGIQFGYPFTQQLPLPGAYLLGSSFFSTINFGVLSPPSYVRTTLPNISNIALPKPPLIAVSSVQYLDVNGSLQTWSSTNYQVVSSQSPGYIMPLTSYPTVQANTAECVRITYTAGYSTVPYGIQQAIMLLANHWYENRTPGLVEESIRQAVHNLLQPFVFEGYY